MKQNIAKTEAKVAVRFIRLGSPERSILPSLTEPEQVTPLEKILQQRMQGIPVPYFNGVFSETDTPDLQKLDFIDIAKLRDETAEGIELAKQDYHALTKRLEELLHPVPDKEEVKKEEKPLVSPQTP